MADVPTTEPSYLTAGDTWTWSRSLSDYPATAGWVLSYALTTRSARIAITASASGADHLVTVTAATTAGYAAGDYTWQAYVTLSTQRYMVGNGSLTVRPNLAAASTGYDTRSSAAKILDAIESYLTTGDIAAGELNLDGRAIKYHSTLDLLKARDALKAEVDGEEAAARAKALGLDPRRYYLRLGTH
jgi:hypothetical protein